MEHKDRTVTVAIITGVIALLLGCCLGAMAGAIGGYFIGHQANQRSAGYIMPEAPMMPEIPMLPEMPLLPDLQGMQGAMVQEVIADSPAEKAGVEVGDIIVEFDGTPINANHRLADVVSQYEPGERVEVKVWREGETRSLKVTLGENPQDGARPYLGVRYADFADQPDDSDPND